MRDRDQLPVLAAEIRAELGKLENLAQKMSARAGRLEGEEAIESTALRLHNLYTGLERIFKLVAAEINGGAPESMDWHKRLLSQMCLEVPDLRPALISRETRKALEELLAFRHLVRDLYGYELDAARVESLAQRTLAIFPELAREIVDFTDVLLRLHRAT